MHLCKVEIGFSLLVKGEKNILSGPADETFQKQYQIIKCPGEFTQLLNSGLHCMKSLWETSQANWHLFVVEDIGSSSAVVHTQAG